MKVGDIVLCRYTGYHRYGEDSNAAVVTMLPKPEDGQPQTAWLTVFGVGTVPFSAENIVVKDTDDGSDRICWPKV